MKYNSLGEVELEVMRCIWEAKEQVDSEYIQSKLEIESQWNRLATENALNKLVKKEYIRLETNGVRSLCLALKSEKDYKEEVSKNILENVSEQSFESAVASLTKVKSIEKEDLKKITGMYESEIG